jgi:hypothetical protein
MDAQLENPEPASVSSATVRKSQKAGREPDVRHSYSRDAWEGALPNGAKARFLGEGKKAIPWLPVGAELTITGHYQIRPRGSRSHPIFRYAVRYGIGREAKSSIISARLIG